MDPGRSTGSSFAFFSTGAPANVASRPDPGVGELRFTVPIAVDPIVVEEVLEDEAAEGDVDDDDDGFFRPFRDGGGGASSMRPCERNWEL